MIYRCDECLKHVKVEVTSHFQTREGHIFERLVDYLNESGRWHPRETLVVQKVSGDLPDARLTGEDTRPEGLTPKRALVVPRVIRCEWLLVDRL